MKCDPRYSFKLCKPIGLFDYDKKRGTILMSMIKISDSGSGNFAALPGQHTRGEKLNVRDLILVSVKL